MPLNPKLLTFAEQHGVHVVTLTSPEMRHAVKAMELQAALSEVIERIPGQVLVIDFSQVTEISSAILGVLISVRRDLQAERGRMAICGLTPTVAAAFRLTRLDQVFAIHPDLATALGAVGGPAAS